MQLIDREDLLEYAREQADETLTEHDIKRFPFIELIDCKDCKWYEEPWCNGWGDGSYTPEDGYCHNAERKEQ